MVNPDESAELTELKDRLVGGMVEYMNGGNSAGYTQKDIDRCMGILDEYLATVGDASATGNVQVIMSRVEKAVKGLNALSSECEELIETDQREVICEIIIKAAAYAGLESTKYDITEDWREW